MRKHAGLLALTLLLALPSVTAADPELTSLLLIPGRTEDPALHDIAHARAYEASLNWSHDGMRPDTAEILAQGPDPVTQWLASPPHAAIIVDPYWNRVSCGTYDYFSACVFTHAEPVPAPAPAVAPTPVSAPSTAPTPTVRTTVRTDVQPTPQPVLPDTATR